MAKQSATMAERGSGLWQPALALVALLTALLTPALAKAQLCVEQAHSFVQAFDTTTHKDPASSVDNWEADHPGAVTLAAKGTTFGGTRESFGERVYVAAAGDFDADGFEDLIGLMLEPTCHLHFLRNRGLDMIADEHMGFDMGGAVGSAGFDSFRLDTPPHCKTGAPGLVSGDFDGDGDPDLLYLSVDNASFAGQLDSASLYQHTGTIAGVPQFLRNNVFSSLDGYGLAWHWTSTIAQTLDWDGDGRDDLVVASTHGDVNEVWLFRGRLGATVGFQAGYRLIANAGLFTPIASVTQASAGGSACPPAVSRGVGAVIVGDYDADDDFDIIVASVSERDLNYWKNDGSDVFTEQPDLPFVEGAVTVGLPGDFDGDGDVDVIVGRDGWNCNGTGGSVFLFANKGDGTFIRAASPLVTLGQDLDFGVVLDIDNDAPPDFIVADGNHTGTHHKRLVSSVGIYNLTGFARSAVIDTLANTEHAITRVDLAVTHDVDPPATDISYLLSNDGGDNWEQVELNGTTASHSFKHFGADLKWKALLRASEETLTGDNALLAPGTQETPALSQIALTYYSVARRRYSRSGLSYGSIEVTPGDQREVIYGASFYFPNFEATVTAFDITALGRGGATGLERVDNHDQVSVLWDAGSVLALRPGSTRVLYGAYAEGGTGPMDDRIELAAGELAAPTTNPTLQAMMALDDSSKAAVLAFIRNGMGSGWKLRDVGHSSPVFVGTPAGDADYMGFNYQAFETVNQSRRPMVYIGANDGFVHAFDATTGAEVWGLAPNNLLGKLKNQRGLADGGGAVYKHHAYVDGSIVVQDVFDGNQWRTLAIVGQALGVGRDDENYYSAIDITNPVDPRPLWEFSDPWDGIGQTCSGDPCRTTCSESCDPAVCSSFCGPQSELFSEQGGLIVFEAESAHGNASVKGTHHWAPQVAESGFSHTGYMELQPNNNSICYDDVTGCGAHMTYAFRVQTAATYYPHFRVRAGGIEDDSLNWGIDGVFMEQTDTDPDTNQWVWSTGLPVTLWPSEYVFDVWMREDGQKLDKIILSRFNTAPSGPGPLQACEEVCTAPSCTQTCAVECVADLDSDEWPECGLGAGLKCCPYQGEHFCAPVAESCGTPDTVLGESWSPPALGRVAVSGVPRWVAFFGSGYNSRGALNVGRSIYAIDAITGELLGRWDLDDLSVDASLNPSTIDNTVPAGPSLVDTDGDGDVDRLYIGDLEGRLWKLEVSSSGGIDLGTGLISHAAWPLCAVFDAGDPDGDGIRDWAPVVTRPATAILDPGHPNVYFGTGGDDRAPDDRLYRFYSVRDTDDAGACMAAPKIVTDLTIAKLEWVVGDGKNNDDSGEALDPSNAEGVTGDRYWSDAVMINDTVFFASLAGDIESINPCLNINGGSKLFGYAIRDTRDQTGRRVRAGQSVLYDSTGTQDFFMVPTKVRRAAISRDLADNGPTRPQARRRRAATDAFLQVFTPEGLDATENPAVMRLTAGGTKVRGRIKILRWREVPL